MGANFPPILTPKTRFEDFAYRNNIMYNVIYVYKTITVQFLENW